jgi:hypothetical protein
LDAIQIRTGSEHRLGAVKPLFKQFYCALRAHFNILFCHSGCKFFKTAAKLRKKIDTRKGMPIFFHLEPNLVLDFPSSRSPTAWASKTRAISAPSSSAAPPSAPKLSRR